MVIRAYTDGDEREWLRCRVLSFLDCSYYNDVLTSRQQYENDAVCRNFAESMLQPPFGRKRRSG